MLLVLGLDGATLDLIDPWIEQGKLPTLARLRREGIGGRLRSTVPPATLPSWTTFMTGVNPGQHGIFDFTRRVPGSYRVQFINSTFRRVPTIWRLLSDAQKSVAVLGMPGTYPPEPINGCMVSGFDVPVTTRANRSFIYPPSLSAEVMRLGGFSFADFQEFYVGPGWHETALARLLAAIDAKSELAAALLSRQAWDCFVLVFGESDTVAHHFWHVHDQRSPRHDAGGAARYGDAIERVYRAIDRAIGRLLRQAGEKAQVLVASDHGFGGAGAKAIYLNRWLAAQGWLRFEERPSSKVASLAKHAALRLVPSRWQAPLFRSFNGRLANGLESRARFAGIDWKHSRAFSEELNYFPSIWINRAGREPLGQVSDAEYGLVCDALISQLASWRDPDGATPIVRNVWRRSEVYNGPWVERAPDLIIDLHEDRGYSYCTLPSGGLDGPPVRSLAPNELVGGKRFGMGGSHRPEGMFLLAADGVVRGGERDAHIADMAPTILNSCGIEAPAWMEGESLLGEGLGGRMPVAPSANGESEQAYVRAEERILEDRLRALGYIS